jgi:NADP-dependent 3-hydroxy acid dehydrogenase YdfG
MKQSIFITGAASGIGRATAVFFAQKGWFVGLFDLNEKGLQSLCNEIGQDRACYQKTDVTSIDSVRKAARFFADRTENKMDLLFNSAGVLYMGHHENIEIEKQKKTIDINITGTLNSIEACLPLLKQTSNAYIINMSSASAAYGIPELAVYSASKHFIRGITEALNIEFEPHDIHVCDIMVSYVQTPMTLDAEIKSTSLIKNTATVLPQDVAQVVWNACHRKKVHWKMGLEFKITLFLMWALPFARRFLVKNKAFSGQHGD